MSLKLKQYLKKMARNIFSLSFILSPQRLSILETAFKLLSLLDILKKEDDVYSKFKISKLNYKSVDFDLKNGTFDENVSKLSEIILQFEKANIKHYEKEESPNIYFSRDFGFSILLEFKKNKKKHFAISCNIASSQWNSFSIQYFPVENCDYDFNWYFTILKKTNNFLIPIYSGVNIILPQYIEMYLPLKVIYPLGWITYFSNESNIKMPNDKGFEVIQEEKGQYIIATREDFTQSKESFFAMKEKLIDGMKLLKSTCIEYSEAETQMARIYK